MSNKSNAELVDFFEITTLEHKETIDGLSNSRYFLKKAYGTGYYDVYSYNGLYVTIVDLELNKDIVLEGAIEEDSIEISFIMQGEQIIYLKDIGKDLIYENGQSYLVYLPNIHESILYRKHCKLRQVSIIMDSSFIQKHDLLNHLKSLKITSLVQEKKDFIFPICDEKQEILTTIINNTQTGTTKRLFLESQCLQLLALQLKEIEAKQNTSTSGLVKKMYSIQRFISINLDTHFTIQELSQKYIINEFVLKKEFKRLFKKTIFEYSTDLRMEKAKELLLENKKPIYEISEIIGYKNATHFSAAFKKHHDISPKQFQKSFN